MDYELSARAKAAIKHITRYTIEKFGEEQADEYIDGLYFSFSLLRDNPRMGGEWVKGKRRYLCRDYFVYYRILINSIRITEIRSTRQKPKS